MTAGSTLAAAVVIARLPGWAAVLVWVAAIAGAIVFVYRRITGAGTSKPSLLDDPDELSERSIRPPVVPPPPSGTAEPVPSAPDPPAPPAPGPVPSAFFVDPTSDRPGIPLTNPPMTAAEAPRGDAPAPGAPPASPREAASATSPRGGFFAPAGSAGPDGAPEQRRLTVAEALRGITMPCGLSPVIDGSVSIPNPFRVAFITTEADAATVGASVGDELEHLGYALTTTTVTEVLARKDGVDLRVVLYPSPGKATRGLDPLFPAAPPGSVGIEFST